MVELRPVDAEAEPEKPPSLISSPTEDRNRGGRPDPDCPRALYLVAEQVRPGTCPPTPDLERRTPN